MLRIDKGITVEIVLQLKTVIKLCPRCLIKLSLPQFHCSITKKVRLVYILIRQVDKVQTNLCFQCQLSTSADKIWKTNHEIIYNLN